MEMEKGKKKSIRIMYAYADIQHGNLNLISPPDYN